jgi:glyoxylase-like metal-dependent hydrolase (beta-lactamase superfamily II)
MAAGRFREFSAPASIYQGVQALAAPGHTPGHTLFSIESKGHRLVIWGDLMEIEAVQFSNPAVTIVFDEDSAQTAALRPRAYREAARERYLVAAAHLPFPGIGHVRAEAVGYSWVPITYDIPR